MGQKMPAIMISFKNVSPDHQWYTVVTKFDYEAKYAHDVISGVVNAGLEDDIIDIVVPIRETEVTVKTRGGKDKTKIKVEKIYPGYVFVKARMYGRVWDYLRNTTGAATILATGGTPISMTDAEMLPIKEACGLLEKEREEEKAKKRRSIEQLREKYTPGTKTTIKGGIFAGYEAKIVSADFGKQKITVALELNGMNVEVHINDLEAL
jgi:transcriptional antiterminator NusG